MEKQDLKGNNANDNLKDLWDEKSDFLNNVVDDALPELDRWNNELKHEPPVTEKKIAELPAAEEKIPEPPRKRDHTVKDKDLVLLIKKYKRASIVCDVTGMTLQTLQNRVGYLSYSLKTYIDVEGLYRDTYPVKLNSDGIKITTGHLVETDFKLDDRFKVDFKDKYIILTRLPRS